MKANILALEGNCLVPRTCVLFRRQQVCALGPSCSYFFPPPPPHHTSTQFSSSLSQAYKSVFALGLSVLIWTNRDNCLTAYSSAWCSVFLPFHTFLGFVSHLIFVESLFCEFTVISGFPCICSCLLGISLLTLKSRSRIWSCPTSPTQTAWFWPWLLPTLIWPPLRLSN